MTQDTLGTSENLNNVMADRREKLNALRSLGQAYPNDFRRDAYLLTSLQPAKTLILKF